MSDYSSILRQSRTALAVLGAAAVLGLTSYLAPIYFVKKNQTDLISAQSGTTAAETDLTARQADLALLKANFSKFDDFKRKGMVGAANRYDWADDLVSSHQRSKLPDTLSFNLISPKPLGVANPASANTTASGNPPGSNAVVTVAPVDVHELQVSIDAIHEVELIQFLNRYQDEVRGRYRLQSCVMTSRASLGLRAECSLYFFNQPWTPAAAAPTP
jgi:hypothetical protein